MEKYYQFYGCYLSPAQHWKCKQFDTVKEAEKYAGTGHPTRLVPIVRHGIHN